MQINNCSFLQLITFLGLECSKESIMGEYIFYWATEIRKDKLQLESQYLWGGNIRKRAIRVSCVLANKRL